MVGLLWRHSLASIRWSDSHRDYGAIRHSRPKGAPSVCIGLSEGVRRESVGQAAENAWCAADARAFTGQVRW
jgi:hypothetical protein